jgi:hypothetical protein
MDMQYPEFKVFVISVAAGLSLEQADFTVDRNDCLYERRLSLLLFYDSQVSA